MPMKPAPKENPKFCDKTWTEVGPMTTIARVMVHKLKKTTREAKARLPYKWVILTPDNSAVAEGYCRLLAEANKKGLESRDAILREAVKAFDASKFSVNFAHITAE